jgi:hypothetical protein
MRSGEVGSVMFFPIRCVFWLTVVFTMIFTQSPTERREAPVMEFSQAVQGVIAKLIGHVETRVAEHCTRQPAECLSVAAKVSTVMTDPHVIEATTVSQAPLPPPRPNLGAFGEHAAPEKLIRLETPRPHAGQPARLARSSGKEIASTD